MKLQPCPKCLTCKTLKSRMDGTTRRGCLYCSGCGREGGTVPVTERNMNATLLAFATAWNESVCRTDATPLIAADNSPLQQTEPPVSA